MSDKKPCIRCLLRELGERELLEKVDTYKNSIVPEERAGRELYRRRLAECEKCCWLNQGICGKCGCFVEARAWRGNASCPHEKPRW